MDVGGPFANTIPEALLELMYAKNMPLVTEIIAARPDLINTYMHDGFTPFHYAWESIDVIKLMLKHGAIIDLPAKVSVTWEGKTLLTMLDRVYTVQSAHADTMRFLVDEGASVTPENSGWIHAHHRARQHALQARRTAAAALVSVIKRCGVPRDLQRMVGEEVVETLDWREWRMKEGVL